MFKYLLLPIILLLSLAMPTLSSNYKINPNTKSFVDQYNRTVIFHGVNAIYKLPPYYPPLLTGFDPNLSLSEIDFQNLNSWGLNFIRLYMSWEGTEQIRGQYNSTYLEIVKNIVQTAAKYNITILLDAHQDVASRKLCGEGFPDWAVNVSDFPAPVKANISFDEKGHANLTECLQRGFGDWYWANDVYTAYKNFYTDVDGILESFTEFWKAVADFFKDEPNILGYEIINEPNTFDRGNLYIDRDYLQPLYQRAHKKIRQVDNNTIIFFEPQLSDVISVSFTETPGGPEYNDRQAFSYHVYCPTVEPSGDPKNAAICAAADKQIANIRWNAANKLGVPGLLSEFGAVSDSEKGVGEINRVAALADSQLHSWAYWQFKFYDDFTTGDRPGTVESFYNADGSLRSAKVKALARSYAYATCGVPVSQSFTPENGKFVFSWKASDNCQGKNTEIYLSEEYYYSKGFSSSFQGCSGCQMVPVKTGQKNYYFVELPQGFAEGTQVTLTVVASKSTMFYSI